jgi:hypothetical protein
MLPVHETEVIPVRRDSPRRSYVALQYNEQLSVNLKQSRALHVTLYLRALMLRIRTFTASGFWASGLTCDQPSGRLVICSYRVACIALHFGMVAHGSTKTFEHRVWYRSG